MRSAYRPCHSVETALLKIHNDVLRAMNTRSFCYSPRPVISAAFDTIDHDISLSRLEHMVRKRGTTRAWFTSYLDGRFQAVHINGTTSQESKLKYGVPQGSVLGPLIFTLYTAPVGEIIRRHGLQFHLHADDAQLYLTFSLRTPASLEEAMQRVVACIWEIRSWMMINKL